MIDDKKKGTTQKIGEALDKAKQVGEIGKVVAPGKAGRVIGQGTEIIDAAQSGLSVWQRISSIFKKKGEK